jgi:hypothetical protein
MSLEAEGKGSFSLVEALSFHRENEPEGEQRKKLLKTLDLLNELSSDENSSSEPEDELSSRFNKKKVNKSSSAKREMPFDLELLRQERSLICKLNISSSQTFRAPFNNCLASELGHYFGFSPNTDVQCQARFRQALEWLACGIAEGEFKQKIYIYAVHLQVLFLISPATPGEIKVYLPISILSLRKFLFRILGEDSLPKCDLLSAEKDNTPDSVLEFTCTPSVLLCIMASFRELSHRDAVMQIYAPLAFPYATVIPNVIGPVKRFVKIVQLCSNEGSGERIVQEQHTFSLSIEGVLFGAAVVDYLLAQNMQEFVVEMQFFPWSCSGGANRRVICRNGMFYLEQS